MYLKKICWEVQYPVKWNGTLATKLPFAAFLWTGIAPTLNTQIKKLIEKLKQKYNIRKPPLLWEITTIQDIIIAQITWKPEHNIDPLLSIFESLTIVSHIKSNLQKDQTNHSRTKEALQEWGRLFYCSSKVSNHRTQLWGVQASQWKRNAFISQRTEKDLHDTSELGKWKGTILQASKSRKTSSQETHLVNNPSNKPATKASNCISRTSTSTTTSKYLKCLHLTFIILHYSSIWLQLLNAQKCLVSPRNQISDYYSSKHLYRFCQFQPNILRQMATQSPMKQVKRNKDTINKPSIFQGQISRKKLHKVNEVMHTPHDYLPNSSKYLKDAKFLLEKGLQRKG